jgi:hypothetical protein
MRRTGLSVLIALILICSSATGPDFTHCTQDNAISVMRVPSKFASPVACFMHGQAYLAGTSIGSELAKTDRVTIVCVPSVTIDGSTRERSTE